MFNRYSQKWLFFNCYGLTLFPFIFYRDAEPKEYMRKHEEYHWRHQLKWLVLPWFIIYWVLFFIYGYKNHPWEKLAREAEK